jgi:choloylglycine hydrolase
MANIFSKHSTVSIPRSLKGIGVMGGKWVILVILPTIFSYLGVIRVTPGRLQNIDNASPAQQTCSTKPISGGTCNGVFPSGCSVFTIAKGDQVFFGGNDDYIHPDSYYWVDPQGYGAIWIGTPDNVQQGVNSKGLAYDANGLPRVDVNPHLERTPVSGGYSSYPIQILRESATVEEVITWVNTHQWHSYMHDQLHFADATGDAVVISAGADSELVFTRKPQGDGHLVSTNFNIANPSNGDYPCWRYETAQELLGGLVSQGDELTVQDAAGVLEAVHVEGGTSWTIESMVADLPNGKVYLYYFHQFDEPVVLNVTEEIANERAGVALSKLFPESVQQEAVRRFERIQGRASRCAIFGMVWFGLVLASLIVLLIASIKDHQSLIFWIPVVAILGPLGLLIWFVARGKLRDHSWQSVMVETVGDVAPMVGGFVLYLIVVIVVPAVQDSGSLQILLLFVLPPILGLVVFHGPLLTLATHQGYLHTLWKRFPHAWVSANLGMAGMFLLAFPVVNMSLGSCSIFPLNPWTLSLWWGFAVLGALLAMVLLMFYEGWAGRRDFRAWAVLATGDGEIATPGWRDLWWWILVSLIILIAGAAAGVMIQQILR